MALSTHTTPSGFLLPSIHSAPPFFTKQPNSTTLSMFTAQWSRLLLAYARHRKLYFLKVEDADAGSDWDEVLQNSRINRKIPPLYLSHIIESMVADGVAAYEPAKQTRTALLYWRLPEEWGEVLHEWASSIESPLTGIPLPLLRKAIAILIKAGRAQTIGVADGEGVRFFSR